jgi:hypothetical protein
MCRAPTALSSKISRGYSKSITQKFDFSEKPNFFSEKPNFFSEKPNFFSEKSNFVAPLH